MSSPVTGTSSATSAAALAAQTDPMLPIKTLGQQDFLNLLVQQLTHQDPMNPESNIDFTAQMAQFSTLQSTTAIQSGISQLGAQQQFLQANALLGRTVTLQSPDGTIASGTVTAVDLRSGTPRIVINNQSYDLSQVLAVTPMQTGTAAAFALAPVNY
jgi:flagellar basal-body rod modification protein FlgD